MPEQPAQLPLLFAPPEVLTVEEIWSAANASLLVKLREDRRIERKPAGIHAKELAEYFSMWANTVDGGLIVVGMEDDGTITGCAGAGSAHANKLDSHGRDNCPDARVEMRRIQATNNSGDLDYLLLFRIYYHPKRLVRDAAGNAFIRYGDTKRKLKGEAIRELEIDKGQVDIEQEPCPSFVFPDDFRIDLINDFVDSVRVRHELPVGHNSAEILELRRLGKRTSGQFIPNTACVLLFARDPLSLFPGCKIRFLRHEGEIEGTGEKWNVVKDVTIEGPIPQLIQDAETVLGPQLREFSRLGMDGKFYTAPEYPKGAWFEAVVNACVHRSFGALKNMNIFVRMFDDRLEIESPGGFPPPVTAENIYEIHAPRNPLLMDAMLYMKYVKCAREGTRRMRESMESADLPLPIFQQKETAYSLVKVTLRNNIKQRVMWVDSDAVRAIGDELAKTLNASEKRAVNFIAENGQANSSQISRLLGRDWQTAQKMLVKLVGRGVLRHIHRQDILRDPKAHFIIAPQAKKAGDPNE
jgi:ATP-dependent DNA helicase RecG